MNKIDLSLYEELTGVNTSETIVKERKISKKLSKKFEFQAITLKTSQSESSEGKVCSYITKFEYPIEWNTVIEQMNVNYLNNIDIEIQDGRNENYDEVKILIHRNRGYSYNFKHCLILHSAILNNPLKIPYFEYMIYLLISFFIQKADYIPLSHLEDFFIDEHDGFVETFGKIGYVPNLASRTTLNFFGVTSIPSENLEESQYYPIGSSPYYSNVVKLYSLICEVRHIVGNHPKYQQFDTFIHSFKYDEETNECYGYKSLEEVKQSEFYKRLERRMIAKEIPKEQIIKIVKSSFI